MIAASAAAIVLCAAVLFVYHKVVDHRLSEYSHQASNAEVQKYADYLESHLSGTVYDLNAQAGAISALIQQIGNQTRDVTVNTLSSYLRQDQTIKSLFVISEPYILTTSDSLLVNTHPGFPIGCYGKITRHENTDTPELSNDLLGTSSEVFDLYRDTKHDHSSKILALDADGEISNTLVCIIPFFNKDKFAGVIGADIDLLATPNYTFEAKTSDYASRFKLVFDSNKDDVSTASEVFAYISDGEIVVNNGDEAT